MICEKIKLQVKCLDKMLKVEENDKTILEIFDGACACEIMLL